jgi:hypothetical protein
MFIKVLQTINQKQVQHFDENFINDNDFNLNKLYLRMNFKKINQTIRIKKIIFLNLENRKGFESKYFLQNIIKKNRLISTSSIWRPNEGQLLT